MHDVFTFELGVYPLQVSDELESMASQLATNGGSEYTNSGFTESLHSTPTARKFALGCLCPSTDVRNARCSDG